jgi:dTDP-glucose pyrophosphorylase
MILITLAGDSTRFFNSGFKVVKYKLMLGSLSVIERILNYIPRNEKILIVLNSKFNDYIFFLDLLLSMSFINFHIVEIDKTKGQFESVILGLYKSTNFWNELDSLTVYNGDTIRKANSWKFKNCDGYLEVFESEGTHWSFVDKIGKITKVTEKNRISSYCSSGLYFFKHIKFILEFQKKYLETNTRESYIAPYYNLLLDKGMNVQSGLVNINNFIFCGTPEEYKESSNFFY